MLRYNIKTGVKKIKTKTAIAASVITLGVGGATFGLALPFAAHATGVPTNFSTTCDAGHGAPGGLGKYSPYSGGVQGEGSDNNTLPNGTVAPSSGSQFGMEQGPNTGLNNKTASQSCNQ
jgi:hypothetical protein